jgi:hypothetical protein
MKSLTPKEARQQLTTLTANIFKLSIEDLSFYLKCAPVDHDYERDFYNRDQVREARNSLQQLDRWHPISDDYLDHLEDTEEMKSKKDFLFICEYLRGPKKHEIGGALADCVIVDSASRSPIFASDIDDMWYHQIVFFICANAYGIEIKGDQLDAMAHLFNIITDTSLSDDEAIHKFKNSIDSDVLNQHWDTEDRVRHFLRIVADIISCIIFPIALIRAADSKYCRGTWNFFKPLSATLPRLSSEIFASMEQPVVDESAQPLQRPLIDEEYDEDGYRPVSYSPVPSM